MAVEIINLCPEKIQLSNNTNISKGMEKMLTRNGMPLTLGGKYLVLPQLNHTQTFNIDGKDVLSHRIILAELDTNNKVVAVRTVGISEINAWFYNNEPVVKAHIDAEGTLQVDSSTEKKRTAVQGGRLAFTVEGLRAKVIEPAVLEFTGRVSGHVEKWVNEGGRWMISLNGDQVEFTTRRINTFNKVDHRISREDMEAARLAVKKGFPNGDTYII